MTSVERVRWQRTVPVVLALLMAVVIGYGVFEGPRAGANALPAPAQYTNPTTNTNSTNPFADPLVIAGVALGILVIVFALLLAFRLRGGGMGGAGREEDSEEEPEEEKDGSKGRPEATDEEPPEEEGSGEKDEGSPPTDEDDEA